MPSFCFVGYGVVTGQGTNHAIVVMLVLSAVLIISSRIEIDNAIDTFVEGASKMVGMFFIFIFFEVMFVLINLGGGFEALGNVLTNFISGGEKL